MCKLSYIKTVPCRPSVMRLTSFVCVAQYNLKAGEHRVVRNVSSCMKCIGNERVCHLCRYSHCRSSCDFLCRTWLPNLETSAILRTVVPLILNLASLGHTKDIGPYTLLSLLLLLLLIIISVLI